MISKTNIKCDYCNKIFPKLLTEIKRYPERKNFCSRKCYFDNKKRKNCICTNCKETYQPGFKKLSKYINNFCSKKCRLEFTIKKHDLTGRKFGRCEVLKIDDETNRKSKSWILKCACGEVFSRRAKDIENGYVYECPNCVFRRSQYYIGGKKYGRLSVQDKWEWRISPTNGKRFRYWLCICECSNELWINADSILKAHTLSCGCYMQKLNSRYVNETLYPIRHGLSGKLRDGAYCRWTILISKCCNPKYPSYHNWGAEGYEVCEKWRNNYSDFHDWMIENKFNESLSIAIKEGKKIFSPENCFLVETNEWHNKMRRKTHLKKYGIEYDGKIHTLKEWSKILNIPLLSLKRRWIKCKDLKKCVVENWNDGSGCHMKRKDISDEEIKHMYVEKGMTVEEIQEVTGFYAVMSRLIKMGIKLRPRKYRLAVINEKIIKNEIKENKSIEEIMEKCGYKDKHHFKRKLKTMGLL